MPIQDPATAKLHPVKTAGEAITPQQDATKAHVTPTRRLAPIRSLRETWTDADAEDRGEFLRWMWKQLDEASRAPLGRLSMQIVPIGRRHARLRPTARAAVDRAPPGQYAIAGGAERSSSSGEQCIAFDTT